MLLSARQEALRLSWLYRRLTVFFRVVMYGYSSPLEGTKREPLLMHDSRQKAALPSLVVLLVRSLVTAPGR